MKNEITFIDVFAGIGGIRLGLEGFDGSKNRRSETDSTEISERPQRLVSTKGKRIAGKSRRPDEQSHRKPDEGTFACIYSNEWDKYCAKIYEKNFHEKPDTRDIRTVSSEEIPDHDLLCAGWPCQSFSIAGKGAGFEDTRGTLFFEIARILRDKRPRYFLLENVKGLLSHQAGKTFQTILGVLAGLGYRCEWQVLNSKNFGVPQNRERVFIVGHLGGATGSEVFPLEKADGADTENTEAEIANCLDANYHKGWFDHGQRTMVIHDKRQAGELRMQTEPCVTKHYGTGGGNVPLVIGNIYPSKGQAGQILDTKGLSKAIVPAKRGGSAVMPIVYHQDIANAVDCDGYLRQMGVHHDKPICHYRIRRLTPIECERLQGFPDGWTEGVSDTQRYRMLGNAVTVNVVEAIGRRIREVLGA